ncbi:MAG: hypothetical protein HUU15_11890, partial [Candidatus Brocadiae bacterium]|nr:hypothetical protein [Candidatus Brocadiia bacterium]
MPHFVPLPFAFATFASRDRTRVMFPVLYPETPWFCADGERLIRAFRDAAERHLLRRGRLSALLPDATPLSFRRVAVRVAVPAAEDGWTHPAMEIDLDGFVAPLAGGGGLGFVPVLGLEAYLPKVERGVEVLEQAARQEFVRHGRVGNPRRLVEVMAAGACAIETRTLDLPFYSPAEVAGMQTRTTERLLPEVATEPAGGEPRVFGREEEVGGVLRALA